MRMYYYKNFSDKIRGVVEVFYYLCTLVYAYSIFKVWWKQCKKYYSGIFSAQSSEEKKNNYALRFFGLDQKKIDKLHFVPLVFRILFALLITAIQTIFRVIVITYIHLKSNMFVAFNTI